MATDLFLRSIGLKLSVNLADWAAPNWQPPEPLPAEMEIEPNASPEGFEFWWIKDGKSKVFCVKTTRLKPEKKYVDSDLAQYEAELGHDGMDPKLPGVHDEIAPFLGQTCFKQTIRIPDEAKTKGVVYIFYARGLRYVITGTTYGRDPIPEEDPILKPLLSSLAFIDRREPNPESGDPAKRSEP